MKKFVIGIFILLSFAANSLSSQNSSTLSKKQWIGGIDFSFT